MVVSSLLAKGELTDKTELMLLTALECNNPSFRLDLLLSKF